KYRIKTQNSYRRSPAEKFLVAHVRMFLEVCGWIEVAFWRSSFGRGEKYKIEYLQKAGEREFGQD
ncbi:MAG: hypothetical protein ACRC6X_01835, partial [Culicoidibacterales bacterium]